MIFLHKFLLQSQRFGISILSKEAKVDRDTLTVKKKKERKKNDEKEINKNVARRMKKNERGGRGGGRAKRNRSA